MNEDLASQVLRLYQFSNQQVRLEETLHRLIELRPDIADYPMLLGSYFIQQKNYQQAIDLIVKAISLQKETEITTFDTLGHAYLETDQFDKAQNCFDQYLSAQTDDPYIWSARAEAKIGLNDLKGALADINMAIKGIEMIRSNSSTPCNTRTDFN